VLQAFDTAAECQAASQKMLHDAQGEDVSLYNPWLSKEKREASEESFKEYYARNRQTLNNDVYRRYCAKCAATDDPRLKP
jgi:hypothetical protein